MAAQRQRALARADAAVHHGAGTESSDAVAAQAAAAQVASQAAAVAERCREALLDFAAARLGDFEEDALHEKEA